MSIIKLSSLSKIYDRFSAVNGVNIQIERGEILGLIGHNGAGKTTTLKMMVGLLTPTTGTVEIMGQKLSGDSSAIKRIIGYLPEESPLYENLTVQQYLLFFAELYQVPRKEAEKRIDELLESLNFSGKTKYTGELSKGMKRKVAIARCLLHNPSILVLDEPNSGLDPLTSYFIIEYLKKLNSQGKTIVLSAHNLYHIEYICHRVAIMKNGQIYLCDTMDSIRRNLGKREYVVTFKTEARLDYPRQAENYVFKTENVSEIASLLQTISDENWALIDLSVNQSALEDMYVKLMQDKGEKALVCSSEN
ncbi:MAG TPA: ABC transporter ATP-binding protein [Dehalococcoidales bacterium]|nr:ABC transporter ATP-binding protein [Dehalococcoidales bacterium]